MESGVSPDITASVPLAQRGFLLESILVSFLVIITRAPTLSLRLASVGSAPEDRSPVIVPSKLYSGSGISARRLRLILSATALVAASVIKVSSSQGSSTQLILISERISSVRLPRRILFKSSIKCSSF